MKRSVIFVTLATAMVALCSIANASTQFQTDLVARYPNTANITCGVCHTTRNPDLSGSNLRNPFGRAFQRQPHGTVAARNRVFLAIEPLDSDGDGFTNLTELTANTAGIHVLPGFATANAQFPASAGFRPTPPRLVFFDNFSNASGRTIPNWAYTTGIWNGVDVGGNVVLSSPLNIAETFANPSFPTAPAALSNFGAGTIEARVQLVSGDQADVVFAQTPADFRMVGISTNEITIGQDSLQGQTIITTTVFGDLQPHLLRIVIGPNTARGSIVTVFVDGVRLGARRFGNLATGRVGFRTKFTRATFDDVKISR